MNADATALQVPNTIIIILNKVMRKRYLRKKRKKLFQEVSTVCITDKNAWIQGTRNKLILRNVCFQ